MKNIAIITGASSGIGKAIYDHLKSNWPFLDVIGVSLNGPDVSMDVYKASLKHFPNLFAPSVQLLINCAGILNFKETPRIMDVNFWGTYNMIKMLEDFFVKDSCIINIASVSGMAADSELPIYAASKAAVISLTESLAKRFAPRIRVNCISPGFYTTNLVKGDTPQELIDTIPMGFEETPNEILHIVKMIYHTRYMTGTNILVDGGLSL